MKRLNVTGFKNRNWLVQWFFVRAVQALNRPGLEIRLVKSLKVRDAKGRLITALGIVDPEGTRHDNAIRINAGATEHKTALGKAATLFHEVLHIIMPPIEEADILKLEAFLWKRLTAGQKAIIASYFSVPKKSKRR